jgi:hypothetical protein
MRELNIRKQINTNRPKNLTEDGVHTLGKGENPLTDKEREGYGFAPTNATPEEEATYPFPRYKPNPYVSPISEIPIKIPRKTIIAPEIEKKTAAQSLIDMFSNKPKAKYTTGRGDNFRLKGRNQ